MEQAHSSRVVCISDHRRECGMEQAHSSRVVCISDRRRECGMKTGSLASHTLRREKKGLVTLQLSSCCRGTQLSSTAVR